MQELNLTPDQKQIHDVVMDWHSIESDLITIGGYAGTGKTTLIGEMVKSIKKKWPFTKIAFCCFTGKASQVLRSKISLDKDDYCGTIHRLIYEPLVDGRSGRIVGWNRIEADALDYGLIVLDEASMVGEKIFKDLSSYNIPILAVGDHGQLPPIVPKNVKAFNLMEDPMYKLEKIHRQAADNPIIQLSMRVREEGEIEFGDYSKPGYLVKKVKGMNHFKQPAMTEDPLILCGMNETRIRLNKIMRSYLGLNGCPVPGDKVICIKNNADKGIYNGMMGVLLGLAPSGEHWYLADVDFGDWQYEGKILKHQFGKKYKLDYWIGLHPFRFEDLFDYGYCITVHKAQGSEAETVTLIEERNQYMDDDKWKRWLYTAVTRARTNLLVIEP